MLSLSVCRQLPIFSTLIMNQYNITANRPSVYGTHPKSLHHVTRLQESNEAYFWEIDPLTPLLSHTGLILPTTKPTLKVANIEWRYTDSFQYSQSPNDILCARQNIIIYSVSQKSSPPQKKNFLRYFLSWWTRVIKNYLGYCPNMSKLILVNLSEYLCEMYHFYRCDPTSFKNSISFVTKFINFS